MGRNKTTDILVKGLASIASNLGQGGWSGSPRYQARLELRVAASKALKEAGYNYYECCGKDNVDGWFTPQELEQLKDERRVVFNRFRGNLVSYLLVFYMVAVIVSIILAITLSLV